MNKDDIRIWFVIGFALLVAVAAGMYFSETLPFYDRIQSNSTSKSH